MKKYIYLVLGCIFIFVAMTSTDDNNDFNSGLVILALANLGLILVILFFRILKKEKVNKKIAKEPEKENVETDQKQELKDPEKIFNASMSWFSVVAVLSIINTLLIIGNTGWSFIFGLTSTQFLDYSWRLHFSEYFLLDLIISIILYLFILASVALAGFLAKKRYMWAMWLGLIFLVLDGCLSFYIQDYWGVGFHAFVIFQIARGYTALRQAHKHNAEIIIKNKSGKRKLRFSGYLILNIIIIFFFCLFFLI